MTEGRLPLAELLAKAGDGDFLRSVAMAVVQVPDLHRRESRPLPASTSLIHCDVTWLEKIAP